MSGAVLAQDDTNADPEAGANTVNTISRTGTGTISRTGTGTLTADAGSPVVDLSVSSASVVGPGTAIGTVNIPADANAEQASSQSYPVPLASSDAACHVPAAVTVAWSSATGGAASFLVQCSAVSSDHSVTIMAGKASVDFDLTQ
jgi:hypothetical protein